MSKLINILTSANCGLPLESGTLDFTSDATVSGLLDEDEVYMISTNADVFVELSEDGSADVTSGNAMFLPADTITHIHTSSNQSTLKVLGRDSSEGLLGYTRIKLP